MHQVVRHRPACVLANAINSITCSCRTVYVRSRKLPGLKQFILLLGSLASPSRLILELERVACGISRARYTKLGASAACWFSLVAFDTPLTALMTSSASVSWIDHFFSDRGAQLPVNKSHRVVEGKLLGRIRNF